MKKMMLLPILLFAVGTAFGQIFTGKQTAEKSKGYSCTISIDSEKNMLQFMYHKSNNSTYGEYQGTIKKQNDTLYHISAIMEMGQFRTALPGKDTFYIQIDSSLKKHLYKIQFEYADGVHRELLTRHDNRGNALELLKIPVDKNLFNANKGSNFVTLTIDRKNFSTRKFLSFRIPFGSSASFTKGQKIEFDVIIKGDELWTVGQPPASIGHFRLKKA